MELRDFISSTIEEISRGILNAGELLKDTNAIVSPHDFRINSEDSQAFGRTRIVNEYYVDKGTRVVQKVAFDIAVTVDESDKAKILGTQYLISRPLKKVNSSYLG